jgi:hypothetical protein
MKIIFFTALVAIAITGCVPKNPNPPHFISGSKADGLVSVGYYVNENGTQWSRTQEVADKLCRKWGYQTASIENMTPVFDGQLNGWGIPMSGKYLITAQCEGETK